MRLIFRPFSALLAAGLLLLPTQIHAQNLHSGATVAFPADLPDAPRPQLAVAVPDPAQQPAPAPQTNPPAQGTSTPQAPAAQTDAEKSQHEKAEEQIKEQEKQRVLGVVPSFNISYRPDAVSLTAAQKLQLAFRSSVDPVAFGAAVLIAGYHEALDDDTGFGWGAEGFGKRAGAAYLDAFDGTIIGNGILPSILHQDRVTSASATAPPRTGCSMRFPPTSSAGTTTRTAGSRTTRTWAGTSSPAPSPTSTIRRQTPAGAKPSPMD